MAQSSAQRDPSMEEILASIRKIIEEGEESRQKPVEPHEEFEPVSIGPAANDTMRRPLAPAPELRKEAPAVETVEAEVFARTPAEPVIRDEVAVEAAQKPNAAAISEAVEEFALSLDDFIIDVEEMRDAAQAHHVESVEIIAQHVEVEPVAENQLAQSVIQSVDLGAQPPTNTVEIVPTSYVAEEEQPSMPEIATPTETIIEAHVSAPTRSEPKPSIVSEIVERKVAASFTELTEALAASRRRPLDEIAEEMMRPMLQDWLDNNLPTLVERLVREEIERVARGTA